MRHDGTGTPRWQLLLRVVTVLLFVMSIVVVLLFDRLGGHRLATTTSVVWPAFAVAVCGLLANRPSRSSGWYEATAAIGWLATGDTLSLFFVGAGTNFFIPANICFLLAYGCAMIAMTRIMRRWPTVDKLSVLLDSVTLAVGVGTVISSLIWMHAPELDLLERPTVALFPLLDLVLIAAIGRYWYSPGGRVASVQILCASILLLVLGHVWALLVAVDSMYADTRLTQLWLPAFVGIAAAVVHPSSQLTGHESTRDAPAITRVHAATLAISTALPVLVLLVSGLTGAPLPWIPVSIGGLLAAALVGLRMWLLARSVQEKTRRIDRLARSDSLTGVANRRHWEHRLAAAIATNDPLWVLIIDLDHFKEFNDSRGHLAGDALLQLAVQRWQAHLPAGGLLARYGGDEFTMLVGDLPRAEVAVLAEHLRTSLPPGQTCSIGIAHAAAASQYDALLRDADLALYAAKRAGRDRVVFVCDIAGPDAQATPPRSQVASRNT